MKAVFSTLIRFCLFLSISLCMNSITASADFLYSSWKADGLDLEINSLGGKPEWPSYSPFFSYNKNEEHISFLKAIEASPDDDLPRLVYADWLDERGESEAAEFIRVQCKAAEIPRPKNYRALLNRAEFLLTRNKFKWFGAMYPQLARLEEQTGLKTVWSNDLKLIITIHRGFVFGGAPRTNLVFGNGHQSTAWMKRIFEEVLMTMQPQPVGVKLRYVGVPEVISETMASKLTALYVTSHLTYVPEKLKINDLTIEVSTRFGHSFDHSSVGLPFLRSKKIDKLQIFLSVDPDERGHRRSEVLRYIFSAAEEKGIKELSILDSGTSNLDPTDILDAIRARSDSFRQLLSLDLSGNDISDYLVRTFLAVNLPSLIQLDLSANAFSATGVNMIAASDLAKKLKYLDISRNSSRELFGKACTVVDNGLQCSRKGKGCDRLKEMIENLYL